jgi:hypothetical protein
MNGEQLLKLSNDLVLSIVNMKLRDHYKNLDDLCDDLDLCVNDLKTKMHTIGYVYNQNTNQFISTIANQ